MAKKGESYGRRANIDENLELVQLSCDSHIASTTPLSVCHLTALGLHLDIAEGGWKVKAVLANSRCWSVLQGAGSRLGTDVWQREGAWQSGAQCWSVWIGRNSERAGYRKMCHFFYFFFC